LDAIGGEADVGRPSRPCRSEAIGPQATEAKIEIARRSSAVLSRSYRGNESHRTELSAFSRSYEAPWTSSDFDSSHPYGILHCRACDVEMQFHHLRRREFLELLGGLTVFWPAAALGQKKVRAIGFFGWWDSHLGLELLGFRFCKAAGRTRMDRAPHDHYRVSLGGGTKRPLRRDCCRVRPT
jgi:hypothetical protein